MASADLNALFNEALGFAEHMLLTHGEFHPFGVSMDSDGKIAQVAGSLGTEHPSASDLADLLQSGFASSANIGSIRAAAVCLDVYTVPPGREQKQDAICARLAHVSGETIEIYVPYARDAHGCFQLEAPFATSGAAFTLVGH